MKSGFDIVVDVVSLINFDAINSQISGRIYHFARPNNSDKVDIVVGLLNANNEFIQEADVNIRIHVPNIQVTTNGVITSYPNLSKLSSLTSLILPYVETQYKNSFNTVVDIPGDIIRDADGTYFSLIRVTYRSIQDNFKNI